MQEPDALLLQEVTAEMYAVVRRRLATWSVYHRRQVSEDYFVVTAVKCCLQDLRISAPLMRSRRPRTGGIC